MIPISARHLTVTPTCDAGHVTFTIVNGETKDATDVVVKRSDGTEHGVAVLPAGGVLVETVPAPGWVSVWATFPTRQWHARVSGSCPAATSTTQPAATTTVAVATPRMTVPHRPVPHRPVVTRAPVTDVFTAATTAPAELPFTGAGTEVTAGVGLALVAAGVVLLLARKRGQR